MAEHDHETRTETPSPRRRQQARAEGKVAVSSDLSAGLVLLAAVVVLMAAGDIAGHALYSAVRADWLHMHRPDMNAGVAADLFTELLMRLASVCGLVLLVVFAAGVAAYLVQVGVFATPQQLAPNITRLGWSKGGSRLLSEQSLLRGILTLVKWVAIAAVVYWAGRRFDGWLPALMHGSLADVVQQGWRLALIVALVLTMVGLIDYLYQRRRHEQSLQLTKPQKKDENKEELGNPLVHQRIHQRRDHRQ